MQKNKIVENNDDGTLYWITGLPGVGKTMIGTALYYELKRKGRHVILLDGDVLLDVFGEDGFSIEDRYERAKKYARLCRILTSQNATVICCTISLFDEIRKWNRENNSRYVEVYVEASEEILEKRDYKNLLSQYDSGKIKEVPGRDLELELPKNPDIHIVNNGNENLDTIVDEILNYDVVFSKKFDRDTVYWNKFYDNISGLDEPSLFAQVVMPELQAGKKLLELGCGNARDSLYFANNGIDVTAIDASDYVIEKLIEEYQGKLPVHFICDDFVCADVIYKCQYDYCYSRFSIHAINAEQERELIRNVYHSLNKGGKFFIEVRSVNDDIYGKGQCVEKNAYIYNGHYRRFIVKQELVQELEDNGFRIIYKAEERGFAPLGDSNPPIIRIFAVKE